LLAWSGKTVTFQPLVAFNCFAFAYALPLRDEDEIRNDIVVALGIKRYGLSRVLVALMISAEFVPVPALAQWYKDAVGHWWMPSPCVEAFAAVMPILLGN
jgi:hypothetical protein